MVSEAFAGVFPSETQEHVVLLEDKDEDKEAIKLENS